MNKTIIMLMVLLLPSAVMAQMLSQVQQVEAGTNISVLVKADAVDDLMGLQLSALYNKDVLELVSITEDGFMNSSGDMFFPQNLINVSNGTISNIVMVKLNDYGNSGTGNIATLTFTAKQTGSTDIFLNGLFSNSTGESVNTGLLAEILIQEPVIIEEPTPNATDQTPPVVYIDTPSDGDAVWNKVTIQAHAKDNVQVRGLTAYIDGTQIGSALGSQLLFDWDSRTVSSGQHNLTITAMDMEGNIGVSHISIFVEKKGKGNKDDGDTGGNNGKGKGKGRWK